MKRWWRELEPPFNSFLSLENFGGTSTSFHFNWQVTTLLFEQASGYISIEKMLLQWFDFVAITSIMGDWPGATGRLQWYLWCEKYIQLAVALFLIRTLTLHYYSA